MQCKKDAPGPQRAKKNTAAYAAVIPDASSTEPGRTLEWESGNGHDACSRELRTMRATDVRQSLETLRDDLGRDMKLSVLPENKAAQVIHEERPLGAHEPHPCLASTGRAGRY